MTHAHRLLLLTTLATIVSALNSASAHAASGIVSGRLSFHQNQGSYCPTGRNCTGARYTERQFRTNQPLRDARIRIVRDADGAVIGQGTTNSRGYFEIRWDDPAARVLDSFAARLEFTGEHADGRFKIVNASGGAINPLSYRFRALPVFTWLNFATFGRRGAANDLANLYDGAQMMWQNSIGQSAHMLANFSGVTIKAYDGMSCPTSCANGPANEIIIDSVASAYNPQSRILHELGHIANYVANPNWKQLGAFDYGYNGMGGWSTDSPEFESAGWEEAIATHAGDVALYAPNAVEPYTCFVSSAPCTAAFDRLENTGNCTVTDSDRVVMNHIRYHWDNYDSRADFATETVSAPIAALWDTLAAFANTDGEGGINEFWDPTFSFGDDLDGRSARDFVAHWQTIGGPDTGNVLATNCGSAGD